MVDGSGLENRRTRKGTGGSNPSLSAIALVIWHLQAGDTYTDSNLNRRCLEIVRQLPFGAQREMARAISDEVFGSRSGRDRRRCSFFPDEIS